MPIEKFSDMDKKRIKLKVLDKVMNKKSVLYHLSYDVINCEKDFDDTYAKAKEYILCVLANTNFESIESYNYSTCLLHYVTPNHSKLLQYLEKHLSPYFNFSISLVAKDSESKDIIMTNADKELNKRFQDQIKNLSCEGLNKKIEQY